jgi:NAD(P)-dependent dehydrogenase (short-subunit alcohol dehydrogenase family)
LSKANTIIGTYGISKAADHHLVKNLAAEWGPKNVRVNAIAPGLVKTDFARALWEDDKLRKDREAATPLRRIGAPRDILDVEVPMTVERIQDADIGGVVTLDDGRYADAKKFMVLGIRYRCGASPSLTYTLWG